MSPVLRENWYPQVCDDTNPDVSPDATEVCDEIDNNCDGAVDDDTAADAPTWYADGDHDGFGDPSSATSACAQPPDTVSNNQDCDESSLEVNPDATEVCDAEGSDPVDNNCDGTVDEDTAADAPTWYVDADKDGFGDGSIPTIACAQPPGYTDDNTDCEDTLPTIYPGADEFCNGLDDDCDSAIDEEAVDIVTWFIDSDGDGFGSAATSQVQCDQPEGFEETDTDCDDGDSSIHPEAVDLCDGLDTNCDGQIDEDVDCVLSIGDGSDGALSVTGTFDLNLTIPPDGSVRLCACARTSWGDLAWTSGHGLARRCPPPRWIVVLRADGGTRHLVLRGRGHATLRSVLPGFVSGCGSG